MMIKFIIKNIKEVEADLQAEVRKYFEEKQGFYTELFKKYDKEMTMELIIDHSSAVYKASVSLNMKSKKMLLAKEGKDLMGVLTSLFSSFKNAVRKQYELERKDYVYKRKR
jgi:predicted RNA-binding protein Jag